MDTSSSDWAIRAAAFRQIRRLQQIRHQLTGADLKAGFQFDGELLQLVSPYRGIFKPQRMEALLSIRTVFPKPDGRVWYDDQRNVHEKIYAGGETIEYSFMGTKPGAPDNQLMRDAMVRQVPIVYFIGVSPGRYQAMMPAFITDWDPKSLKALVAFGDPASKNLPKPGDAAERRYALRLVQQRLHQASFRGAVIAAYRGRCALSGMPESLLLDAAHIISDGDENLGQPVVPNGIPLSKIHHAAFDSHLIGVDPDFRVHVSDRLLVQHDGPLLESMKKLHLGMLHLPKREQDRPDRDRLALRFEQFRAAA